MKKLIVSAVLATSVFGLAACGSAGISNDVVATSNAGDITSKDLYNKMKDTAGLAMLKQMAIEDYLKKNYKVSDKDVDAKFNEYKTQNGDQFKAFLAQYGFKDEAAFKDRVKIDLLTEKAAEASVTKSDLAKYKPEIRASHILVKDEATAKKVEDELAKGADFAAEAKKYSTDTGSKDKGGDLGYFGEGAMVPEFEAAAYKLKVGEISQPVKSQFGYHVIKLTGKKTANEKDARKKIAESKLSQENFQAFSDELLKKAKFKVKDKDLESQVKKS
ncbi:peptidylprolyl isomerase [Bacillus sp. AFS053548]|uniref:peptidylprolyl isomerase n=1 Tax=Bacillus sp. AFS053548 TaxID=2033505 RepID=UPI000BFCBED0|nr:peptidylprolyl isomerase [Bacillus sp. AFS053548]PGM56407.1 peptidylprolyl isomerase [Bacillus sp. AFS053548]